VTLAVRRVANGPVFAVEVVPERIRPNEFFLKALRTSVRVIEHGGQRLGYVRIWSYARREYHRVLIEELAEGSLKDVDGLVLDLRGGWGGAQPEYAELFVGGAPIMSFVGRDGREAFASFRWRRPVVVLVDEGTRSGKEVVAFGLQRQAVPVVGSRTSGALLAARGFLLSDGSLLVLAVSDVRVEGERLEGRGVVPDLDVPFRLPYAAGRDPQLDAALGELAQRS
jgi:carboxyl-terminal processing protease